MRVFAKFVVSTLALGMLALPAPAQDSPDGGAPPGDAPRERPPRGQGRGEGLQRQAMLTPEQAKAAWEWEAKGVAKRLGFSDEHTQKTVAAYVEARESFNKAMDKVRQEMEDKAREAAEAADANGDESPGEARRRAAEEGMKLVNDTRKAEAEKLSTALGKFLPAEQTPKAMTSLGTFSFGWDNMTHSVVGFNLGDEKTYQSLNAIETYVVTVDKNRENTDREAMRTAMTEARDTLVDAMKKILSEEQLTQFQRSIGRGMGMGMGGAPGGRGGDGAPGGRGRGGAGGAGGGGERGGQGGAGGGSN